MVCQADIYQTQWASLLFEWFNLHRRELPWREIARDPYKVWVSEIMLQQTKVETVKPYYENWMDTFPTLETLAAASEEDVLRQWQGLGYYSRARNLHQAVKEVVRQYDGKVPDTKQEIMSLKGIGEYTAGAILSLAYGKDEVAVDGNVLRIFARLYDIKDNVLQVAVKQKVLQLAQAQIPMGQAGKFNEALMDFGSLVCIPKHPTCPVCPLRRLCLAHQRGCEKDVPYRGEKRKVPIEYWTVGVIKQGDCVLVHQRPDKGLLASMWEFPMGAGRGKKGKGALTQLLNQIGVTVDTTWELLEKRKHVFSHKIWQLGIYLIPCVHGNTNLRKEWQWLPIQAYQTVPWAGPHGKITALL